MNIELIVILWSIGCFVSGIIFRSLFSIKFKEKDKTENNEKSQVCFEDKGVKK